VVNGGGDALRPGAAPVALAAAPTDALSDAAAILFPDVPPLPAPGAGLADAGDDPRARAWAVLRAVPDPEVPAVSVVDLGIVRAADPLPGGGLRVTLTPTYSGCPATEAIERGVREALDAAGLGPVEVALQRAPAWTTDWITPEGRARLRAAGIAPPGPAPAGAEDGGAPLRFFARGASAPAVQCPRCASPRTEQLAAFGATACKSLWRCLACREPFEHFKPL
jgi:ring-1,2-phenylacetyl-CoA epoxidase subunit PaaD